MEFSIKIEIEIGIEIEPQWQYGSYLVSRLGLPPIEIEIGIEIEID